jgi:Double-GTPase 1
MSERPSLTSVGRPRSVTVLGVTGSGKSTWIGALADALARGAPSRIIFDDDRWPDDTTSMDRSMEYLQTGRYPLHTTEEQHSVVELPLKMSRGRHKGDAVTLKVSDYDGEIIEKLFLERTHGWDDAWQKRASADSILVFLRHDFTKGLRRLVRRALPAAKHTAGQDSLLASSPDELGPSPLPDLSLPETPVSDADDPRYVPTTLALVELLQWIRRARNLLPVEMTPFERPLRVGVVFTAWDGVAAEWRRELPELYLATHHALLKDYLASNFREHEVRVFALSATGGNLADPSYRARYLEAERPSSRVYWKGLDGKVREDSDLAVPLGWALFGEPGITDE